MDFCLFISSAAPQVRSRCFHVGFIIHSLKTIRDDRTGPVIFIGTTESKKFIEHRFKFFFATGQLNSFIHLAVRAE